MDYTNVFDVMLVEQKPWVIYGRDNCSFCYQAEAVLDGKKQDYAKVDIGSLGVMDWFATNDWKTVPQIFYMGEHIGGYKELKAFIGEDTRFQRPIRGDASIGGLGDWSQYGL